MIKVRPATRYDVSDCVDLMLEYRKASPIVELQDSNDQDHVANIFNHIIAGMGRIFIAERDYDTIGMLVAVRQSSIWNPEVHHISELAYWVMPEHRGSRAGYLLIREYINWAQEMKQNGLCEFFTISKMINSPDLDYSKFGFEKLEESWRI